MSKVCTVCSEKKPRSEFHNRTKSKDGKAPKCKQCDNAARKKHFSDNKENQRSKFLQRTYRIDLESYNSMYEQQGGKCAICGQPEKVTAHGVVKALAVDHCHDSGTVRKLLCQTCNVGLGAFMDNLDLLAAATDYLLLHKYNGHT